ncbi:MAG: hypothetical protein HY901_01800 [Deltaproteobacteria bacterium]|nr:hypothetical protein [Deltaproteobacteria bacterium]
MGLFFGALHLGVRTGLLLGVVQRMSQLLQVPVGLVALALAPHRAAPGPA